MTTFIAWYFVVVAAQDRPLSISMPFPTKEACEVLEKFHNSVSFVSNSRAKCIQLEVVK